MVLSPVRMLKETAERVREALGVDAHRLAVQREDQVGVRRRLLVGGRHRELAGHAEMYHQDLGIVEMEKNPFAAPTRLSDPYLDRSVRA